MNYTLKEKSFNNVCVYNILVVIDDIFILVVEDVVKMREEKAQIAVVAEGTYIIYNTNFR